MSIVLKTFFPFFTILSFYTKHMFKFIYVNQLIHMVILVDNVDKAGDKVFITSRLVEKNFIRFLSILKFHPFFIKVF